MANPPFAAFIKLAVDGAIPIDGFDFAAQYQMVPLGGSRKVTLFTDEHEWMMITSTPGIVRLTFPPSPPIKTEIVNGVLRFIVPKFAALELTLGGEGAGATDLIVQPRDFSVTKSLRISVKSKVQKKFAIRMLSDIRRSATRTKADALAAMARVSDLFLAQTNTELVKADDPKDVLVTKDLGNPMNIDKNLKDITQATPGAFTDFWVYCSWDISDTVHGSSIVGDTTGTICFMEDGAAAASSKGLQLFAHEIGHAFGLDHNSEQDHLMFKNSSGGQKLRQFEIDKVNTSGVVP